MKLSKAIVKYRIPILILAVVLLIPATIGYLNTRVNYDMLDYLPADMDTVIGQNELLEDFGKGAFSFIIAEGMPAKDVSALKAKLDDYLARGGRLLLSGSDQSSHFQLETSGRSWPYSWMYCLCSTSLSLIF